MTAPKILVVDDKSNMRKLIIYPLQRQLGAEILEAWGAHDGMELALSENPDLIVLDMIMPQVDGWEMAARLKGQPATAAIPILALTVACSCTDRFRALDAGCDMFLPKPFTISGLVESVQKLLAASHLPV